MKFETDFPSLKGKRIEEFMYGNSQEYSIDIKDVIV